METDTGTYGITGLPRHKEAVTKTKTIPFVTGLPLRYEISAFATSKDKEVRKQWTLFVLALEKFKSKSIDQKLSYFQVAGIVSTTEWPLTRFLYTDFFSSSMGIQRLSGITHHRLSQTQPASKNQETSPTEDTAIIMVSTFLLGTGLTCCSLKFVPLISSFPPSVSSTNEGGQQCIWDNMKEVIQHWVTQHGLPEEDAEIWRAAANKWRLPYWDWARRQSYTEDFAYPEILTRGYVRIYPPKQVQQFYPPSGIYSNPLWGFENPELDENGDPRPFGDMPEDKKQWNILDDPVRHDDAPPKPEDDVQWMPVGHSKQANCYP